MNLNILTFNWHEPYICHLSLIKHHFYVVAPEIQPGKFRQWDTRMRPLPENAQCISLEMARSLLREGKIDLAIAHNVKDVVWLREYELPKICVFHCRLSTEIALSSTDVDIQEYRRKVESLLDDVTPVFISASKKQDWGLAGEVIVHGIDVDQFPGYSGERPEILRVGNLLKEMDLARGFSVGEKILSGFPSQTLGLNPTLPGSRFSNGYEDLKDHYKSCRLYLNTLPPDYEDGYNFSLLEAMATGMPVVSTFHPDSPIKNGMNGFVSADISFLREKCDQLLKDQTLAKRLGAQSRETIREQFPIVRFVNAWNKTIEGAIKKFLDSRGFGEERSHTPFEKLKRKNILMDFVSHPATTAYYLERAFRKHHNVITCGAMINEDVIDRWDLKSLNWPIEPQDIFRGTGGKLADVLRALPKGWTPDFYFYVETGLSDIPVDLDESKVLKVCYLIDTHLHLQKHLEQAQKFDVIFIAQKEYLKDFNRAGIQNVQWLPLACDPEIHGKQDVKKEWDVGFVGSITPSNPKRKLLLEQINQHFQLNVSRKFMDEMAGEFCRSRIVFNNAIKNDLNMRVFEALCSGSMLVTDAVPSLGELFESGKHLAVYQPEILRETIQYYLDNPEERETIAECGRQEVLKNHTYEHRIHRIIEILNSQQNRVHEQESNTDKTGETSGYYSHVRHDLLSLIPQNARTVLEIGCGEGATGAHVKEIRNVFWAGVELNASAAEQAQQRLDDVVVGNIEELELPYQPDSFDCLFCGDVLEHLVNPLEVLKKLKKLLKNNGVLVTSIPNVQFFGVLNHLAEGNWTYQDEGILDKTHLRFFTFNEIKKLMEDAGFEISQIEETLDPQYEQFGKSGQTTLKIGRITIDSLSSEEMKRFFVFQYRIQALNVLPGDKSSVDESDEDEEFEKLYEITRKLEEANEWGRAEQVYAEILQKRPEEVRAMVGKANCALNTQKIEEAQLWLEKVLELECNNAEALLAIGVLLIQQNDFVNAESSFLKMVGLGKKKEKAYCGLGMICQARRQWKEAMNWFYQALEIDPESNMALSPLIRLAWSTREFTLAERAIRKFLVLHPANLNMCFGLAGILFETGDLEESREVLHNILIFEPRHKDALELLEKISNQEVNS